jgi:hypothetical protein
MPQKTDFIDARSVEDVLQISISIAQKINVR